MLSVISCICAIFNNYNKSHENRVLLTRENKLCLIACLKIITCDLT